MKKEPISPNSTPGSPPDVPTMWRKTLPGYVFASACLVWVLYSVDFANLFRHLGHMSWSLVILAVLLDVLSYMVQGIRWSMLLRSIGYVSAFRTTEAVYTGLFVNEVMPMKVGELARGYLVSQTLKTRFLKVLPTMAVERFFDGIWMVVGIGITACFVSLPADMLEAGEIFGAIVILGIGIFLLLVRSRERSVSDEMASRISESYPLRPFSKITRAISDFGSQIRIIGLRSESITAFLLSLALILLQAVSFWFVIWAYGISISFWAGMAVFIIVHLGAAVPAAPANIGSYQFFTVLGLTLFGVDKTNAAGFSIVVFMILTIPLWALGFFAFSHSGLTLSLLRKSIAGIYPRD